LSSQFAACRFRHPTLPTSNNSAQSRNASSRSSSPAAVAGGEAVEGEGQHLGIDLLEDPLIGGLRDQVLDDARMRRTGLEFEQLLLMARPTLSRIIYMQQLGRGTRKAPGTESLLVFDFVDNAGRFNQSWDLHRLIGTRVYRLGRLVLAPTAASRSPG
jgi:hypothetical protein